MDPANFLSDGLFSAPPFTRYRDDWTAKKEVLPKKETLGREPKVGPWHEEEVVWKTQAGQIFAAYTHTASFLSHTSPLPLNL